MTMIGAYLAFENQLQMDMAKDALTNHCIEWEQYSDGYYYHLQVYGWDEISRDIEEIRNMVDLVFSIEEDD